MNKCLKFFIGIAILTILVGCSSKKTSKWEYSGKPDREALASLNFNVSGCEYTLPGKFQDFVNESSEWKPVADNVLYETGIMPLNLGTIQLGSEKYVDANGVNNFSEITLENTSNQATNMLSSCPVVGYRIKWTGKSTTPNLVMQNGITWLASMKDIKNAYGDPDNEDSNVLNYYADQWEVTFIFDENKLTDVSLLYKDPNLAIFSSGDE